MKALHVSICLVTTLLLAGCSDVKVLIDYDREADFSTWKSYRWREVPQDVDSAGAETREFQQRLSKSGFREAVNEQLKLRGITEDSTKPDFTITYHLATEQMFKVRDAGYNYSLAMGPSDVKEYDQGTIILDFIDAGSDRLLWRGTASGALAENPDSVMAERKLKTVVKRMLDDFPPPAKDK